MCKMMKKIIVTKIYKIKLLNTKYIKLMRFDGLILVRKSHIKSHIKIPYTVYANKITFQVT